MGTSDWLGLQLAGGRYEVTSCLGAGGMAVVYLARDRNLNCEVVIKLPHPGLAEYAAGVARFV